MQALARPLKGVRGIPYTSHFKLTRLPQPQHRSFTCAAQSESQTDTAQGPSTTTNSNPAAPAGNPASTSSSNSSTAGFLSSKDQQAAAFGFLSATSLAFGVSALAAPELLLSVAVGGDATALDVAFTRIAGATMFISAAAEYSLRVRWCCTHRSCPCSLLPSSLL
jgi:hypothetical protein